MGCLTHGINPVHLQDYALSIDLTVLDLKDTKVVKVKLITLYNHFCLPSTVLCLALDSVAPSDADLFRSKCFIVPSGSLHCPLNWADKISV